MIRPIRFSLLWLLLATYLSGCARDTSSTTSVSEPSQTVAESQDHHHGAGPHGGTIADWGGGTYHVEFTVDHEKQEATVYLLGSDGKSSAPVAAEKVLLSINDPAFQIDLVAQPLEGESEGKSSRFSGQHENLGIVREFEGTVSGVVDDTPYAADFKEEAGEHKH